MKRKLIILLICLFIVLVPSFLLYKHEEFNSKTYNDLNNDYLQETLSEHKDLLKFLNSMPQKDGNFRSTRIDNIQGFGSIDQTYYNMKIKRMFNSKIDLLTYERFKSELLQSIVKDYSFSRYLDLGIEYFTKDDKIKIKDIYLQQIDCDRDCIDNGNPYLIYYLSKVINQEDLDKSKNMEILSRNIINENDMEVLVYYLSWYFDWINHGYTKATTHKQIINKAKYILNRFDYKKINDFETLYNYIQLSVFLNDKVPISDSYINKLIKTFSYTFDASELYYKMKIVSKYKVNFIEDNRKFIDVYFKNLSKMPDYLYPMTVYEENNILEILNWELIMNHLLKTKNNIYTEKLINYVQYGNNLGSQKEIYYQVLLFKLTNKEYPEKYKKYIFNRLQNKEKIIENFYLYQAARLLNKNLDKIEIQQLKKESDKFLKEKDEWGIVNSLYIWLLYDLDKSYVNEYWKKSRAILEEKSNLMIDKSFFYYQIIKYNMGESLNKKIIDKHFNIRENNTMLIIKGKRGEMDIFSICDYFLLLDLLTIQDNKQKKEKLFESNLFE